MTIVFGGRTWRPRMVRPHAAEWLAQLGAGDDQARLPACDQFLAHVLPDDEHDQLTALLLSAESMWDADTLLGLVRAVVDAQSARPLRAVVALCGVMVRQWTTISGMLRRDGHTDPIGTFPTLWSLLDVIEAVIVETREDDKARDAYWRDLYMPVDQSVDAPPPGWTAEDELAMFKTGVQ